MNLLHNSRLPLRHMLKIEQPFARSFGLDDIQHTPHLYRHPNFTRQFRGGNLGATRSLSEAFADSVLEMALQVSMEARSRLTYLMNLKHGWDGDDARPIDRDVFGKTLMVLALLKRVRRNFVLPFLAPTFSGQLLLDWTSTARTLELESTPRGWIATGTIIHLNGEREYYCAECRETDEKILNWYDWFAGNELIWPQ